MQILLISCECFSTQRGGLCQIFLGNPFMHKVKKVDVPFSCHMPPFFVMNLGILYLFLHMQNMGLYYMKVHQ
jgi:hypothetical protein